jgi:poly(3-hydroxyalkanoate) synthetase
VPSVPRAGNGRGIAGETRFVLSPSGHIQALINRAIARALAAPDLAPG